MRVLDSCEIDTLRYVNVITQDQHSAAAKFMEECFRARLMTVPGINTNRTSQSDPSGVGGRKAVAISKIQPALKFMISECGPSVANLMVEVVAWDRKVVKQGELEAVRSALDCLCRFYSRHIAARKRRLKVIDLIPT
jgi:hypothetical protein